MENLNYSVTFKGLHSWYKKMFEKLGWMVLAERDERIEKIKWYKKSINHLIEAIKEKHDMIEEADRKLDLHIMLNNAESLRDFVNNAF